jgi:hypothetical protein
VELKLKNDMTNEELMTPRFRVIADYPNSLFKIGEILTGNQRLFCDKNSERYSDFPNIFQPLEWWEERSLEDLPKYLRFKDNVRTGYLKINDEEEPFVHKVKVHFRYSTNEDYRYSSFKRFVSEWKEQEYNYNQFLPSTEEYYLEYIKTLEK